MIGSGITGRVGGHDVVVGKQSFVQEAITSDGAHTSLMAASSRDVGTSDLCSLPSDLEALTTVWIAVDGHVVARAWFGDAVRPDAARAIRTLRLAGWHVGMASGDDQGVADAEAAQVGIEPRCVVRGASPEAKLAIVERASRRQPVVWSVCE
jgi:P-type E1-E2 ATPase